MRKADLRDNEMLLCGRAWPEIIENDNIFQVNNLPQGLQQHFFKSKERIYFYCLSQTDHAK